MTGHAWADFAISVAGALLIAWLALVGMLVLLKPRNVVLREALRLLPDVLILLRRLAADDELPRGIRVRLAMLMAYLAMPIDLVPDFVPVLGHADDAIIVVAVLRSVVRRAGLQAVRRHWPGTEDGFMALGRLAGMRTTDVAPGDPEATST